MKKIILTKPRAKTQIEIVEKDPEDGWFIYVSTIEVKSGKKTHTSLITSKDLPVHLSYLKGQGWVEQSL